ncbi:MAG: hypothetical protein Q4E75_03200 [bacterium]|nr:hypothetical protein [bacterium]
MLNVDDIASLTDERLKPIIRECFESMLKKYGADNFLRWLNEKNIDEKLKNLIITKLDVNKYPNSAGYYNSRNNELSYIDSYSKGNTIKVMNHEFNHFLSSKIFKEKLTGFINEGVTEYLAQKSYPDADKTYYANVDFVSFLHQQIGDILIKAYFTGDTRKVEQKLEDYIGTAEFINIIKKLDQIYNDCYEADHNTTQKIIDTNIDFFANLYMDIYKGRIVERSKNLEFYENGTLNIVEIRKAINILKFPKNIIDYLNKNNKLLEYKESLIEEILMQSHLAIGDDLSINTDKIKQYSKAIMNSDTSVISEITNINNMEFQNLFLLQCKNKNFNLISIHEKADIIFKILNRFPDDYVKKVIDMPYVQQILGPDYKEIIEYYLDNKNTYININKIMDNRTRNTIESNFIVINPWLVIEKRDNAFYLLSSPQYSSSKEYELKGENPIKVPNMNMFNNKGKMCEFGINLDEDLNKITFIPNNIKAGEILNLEEFGTYMKSMPYIQKVVDESLKCKKVLSDTTSPYLGIEGLVNLKGEVGLKGDNYQTVKIEPVSLKKSLEKLRVFLPNTNFEKVVKYILIKYLSFTYYVDDIPNDIIKQCYDILFNKSEFDIYDIEQKMNKLKNAKMDELANYPVSGDNKGKFYDKRMEKIISYEGSIDRPNANIYVNNYLEKEPDSNHFYGLPLKTLPDYGIMYIDIIGLSNHIKTYERLCRGIKDSNDYIDKMINKQINFILNSYGIDSNDFKILNIKQEINTIIRKYVENEEPKQILLLENMMNEISKYRQISSSPVSVANLNNILDENIINSNMQKLLKKLEEYDKNIKDETERIMFINIWKKIMDVYRYTNDIEVATNKALKLIDYFGEIIKPVIPDIDVEEMADNKTL